MARREVERQLRLFGVGDLGPPEEDDVDGSEGSDDDRWDAVFRHLGKLLREEGFEDYLTRQQRGTERPDG